MTGPRETGPAATLLAPLRAAIVTMVATPAASTLLAVALGAPRSAATMAGICATAVLAWVILRGGRPQLAAGVAFYGLAIGLAVFLWVGRGTSSYGIAAFPFVLFLGSVFLAPLAYWGLAACVLASVTALWAGEASGVLRYAPGAPGQLGGLFGLWIVMFASAAGGRVLTNAMRASHERLQKVFHASQNAIVVSRALDGKYIEVNDAYLSMFGYRREEVIGRTALELGVWEDRRERERFVRQVQDHKAVSTFEARLRKKSGELMNVEISAEALEVDGEACLVVSTADVTAQREAERRAEILSTRDALTGLPNRALAIDRLERAIVEARDAGHAIAVMHIDVDRFAAVNESVGRASGDALLRDVCARLESMLRAGDTLARIGGDEFLLISDSLRHPSDAERLAAKVASAFEGAFPVEGRSVRISCSIGSSLFPADSRDPESLLLYAETALHAAKAGGRGRHCAFDRSMDERVRKRLLVESCLRESLAGHTLRLAYQPIFDMRSDAVVGLEALARWSHPELGEVSPAQFIAVAEESELIVELGSWAIHESCAQLAQWRRQGLTVPPVAVNLSARQLTGALPGLVSECVQECGLEPRLLELEITETMLIASPEGTRKVLEQLAHNGNSVVLDDFGVGYSSLSYLKLLHLNGIKVDRSFVGNITGSRHDRAIVSAIVGLAHGLGFRVVAEGIETEAQLAVLRELGCDSAQGFHLCRPRPGGEIASEFLARGRVLAP